MKLQAPVKSITFLVVIALILLNGFLSFKIFQYRSSEKYLHQALSRTNKTYTDLIGELERYIDITINLERDLQIEIDSASNFPTNNRNTIVLLFSEDYCLTCIQRILQDFSLLKEKTGLNDFVAFGAFASEEKFDQIKEKFIVDLEFKWVYCNSETIARLDYPFVFVLNPNSEIKFLFSPEVLPSIRNWYFYTLLQEYITLN